LDAQHATQTGAELSETFKQLFGIAREKGANLIVLFSNENGVDIPIRQCGTSLRLGATNPVITAVLFQCDPRVDFTACPKIKFSTKPAPKDVDQISYTIDLMKDTAGISKSYWTYGNIARFVADAVSNKMDTIVLEHSTDEKCEDVWLPGCDQPVRISLEKPKLVVKIFKTKNPPNKALVPTVMSVTPAADAPVAPATTAAHL
jgi:hypothetical protein